MASEAAQAGSSHYLKSAWKVETERRSDDFVPIHALCMETCCSLKKGSRVPVRCLTQHLKPVPIHAPPVL